MYDISNLSEKQIRKAEYILVFVLCVAIFIYEIVKNKKISRNSITTIGIVYNILSDGDTQYTDYYYYVGDSLYKNGIIGTSNLNIGDTFYLKYSKSNPKDVIILDKKNK